MIYLRRKVDIMYNLVNLTACISSARAIFLVNVLVMYVLGIDLLLNIVIVS